MNKMCSEDRYNCASISNETQTFHLKFKQNFKHKSEMSLILLYFYQIDGHLHTGKKPPHSLHHPMLMVSRKCPGSWGYNQNSRQL